MADFVGFNEKRSVALGFNCKVSAIFTDRNEDSRNKYRSLTVIFQTDLLSVASLIAMCVQCPLCLNLV